MAATTRQLFPTLPPELRSEIYTYLSHLTPNQPASTFSLPLKFKSFSCRHTTIQICPVHYGSTSLLSLTNYSFLEAAEYKTHLLQNRIELRIGIVFRGRVNTFVQADWDKRITAHLKKLVKGNAWLGKVAKVDVRISWDPSDGVLRSKRGKRVAGDIIRDMVGTVVGVLDGGVVARKGDLRVRLGVEHRVVVEHILGKRSIGFVEVMKGDYGVKRVEMDVVLVKGKKAGVEKVGVRFVKAPEEKTEEKQLMVVERSLVTWTREADEQLVMRKQLKHGKLMETVVAPVTQDAPDGFMLHFLADDCSA